MTDQKEEEESAIEDNIEFPGPSQWYNVCSCCGVQLGKLTEKKGYYINHWHVKFFPIILIIFLVIASSLTYVFMFRPKLIFSPFYFDIIMITFEFMFFSSYLVTIFEDPGFLPFYYPIEIENPNSYGKDYLSGIVSTFEQAKYVKSKPKMNRTHFFKSVGRYVVRPDHYCFWVQQFIAKRNMKTFILFNIYGTLLCLYNFILALNHTVILVLIKMNVFEALFLMGYMVSAGLLLVLTINFMLKGIRNTTRNTTHFEKIHPDKRQYTGNSCCENWEDVFGSRKKFLLWPLPIPPYHNVDAKDLANLYL